MRIRDSRRRKFASELFATFQAILQIASTSCIYFSDYLLYFQILASSKGQLPLLTSRRKLKYEIKVDTYVKIGVA